MADDNAQHGGPKFWSVVDGAGSRVVREGQALGSRELPEKLGPGSLVQEIALEGDRLHYWLQSGSGPTNGWVTIKVRGKELLVRAPEEHWEPIPEVWIMTMGTRGDLQPFVVLGLALQDAGFRVRIFGPPELKSFTVVANGTLEYEAICGGWAPAHLLQQITQELEGFGQEASEAEKPQEPEEDLRDLALGCPATASGSKNEERAPACAVDGWDQSRWTSLYADNQWLAVDLGEAYSLSRVEIRWEAAYALNYLIEASHDGETWSTLADVIGREGWVATDLPKGSSGRWVRMFGKQRARIEFGFSIWQFRVLGRAMPEQPAAEEQPAQETQELPTPGPSQEFEDVAEAAEILPEVDFSAAEDMGNSNLLKFLSFIGVDTKNGGDVGHMVWMWREMPIAAANLKKELESQKPDLLLFNHLMVPVGLYAWRAFAVRSLFVNLGLEFHFAPQAKDVFNYRTLSAFDSWVMRRITGVSTVSSMRPKDFLEFYTSPDRILGTTRLLKSVMPLQDKDRGLADAWNFTGFWIFDEEKQMEDPTAFGGPDVLQRLKDFVENSARPVVYLGWGSMPVGPRVLAICVAALKKLRLRAIAVRGWGYFSMDFLWQGIQDMRMQMQETELMSFAEKNVIIIDKAPHEWLFPRCSCTVHHGGAGTTAAALRAGVPTIIVPLGYDQTYHGDWVESLGVGVKCSSVMELQELEFYTALQRATSDELMRKRSGQVAATIRQEPGVAGAVAQIRRVIREDVRSGASQARWDAEEAKRQELKDRVARRMGQMR